MNLACKMAKYLQGSGMCLQVLVSMQMLQNLSQGTFLICHLYSEIFNISFFMILRDPKDKPAKGPLHGMEFALFGVPEAKEIIKSLGGRVVTFINQWTKAIISNAGVAFVNIVCYPYN
jgi:hypothetical protein